MSNYELTLLDQIIKVKKIRLQAKKNQSLSQIIKQLT